MEMLYERFFGIVKAHSRTVVRCETAPVNRASVAFHTRIGFIIEPADGEVDGIPVKLDYKGPGRHQVLLKKML